MTKKENAKDLSMDILSIGTEILTKDVMDQFLRSLGGIKTYYASKLSVALETYREKNISIVFCEHQFQDGTVQSFINRIGGVDVSEPRYFIVASKDASPELEALRKELNIHEVLLKPFSTEDVLGIVTRAIERIQKKPEDWLYDLRICREAYQAKRFNEAEQFFKGYIKKYGNHGAALLEAVEYFLINNKLDVVEELLERILLTEPNSARALGMLGILHKKKGNIPLGLQYLRDAHAISPLNSARSYEMAEAEIILAEDQLRKSIEHDPFSSANHVMYIKLLVNRGQFTKAIKHMETKREFFGEEDKKEAEIYVSLAKKLAGLK